MGFAQHTQDCDLHPGCVVVVGELYGREVFRSHHTAALPVGTRLNIDYPVAERARWQLATVEEAAMLSWTPEEHRRLAFHATQRDLFTQQELAAIRDVLGVNLADLQVEANEKGWDQQAPARRKP